MNYYSQIGQDKYYIENIAPKDGIFLDIGAYDGVFNSNTYALEKHLRWAGYCVEANPVLFSQLSENRTCTCIEGAAWNKKETLVFEVPTVDSGTIYGKELGRIEKLANNKNYFKGWFDKRKTYTVEAFPIQPKIQDPIIDYLSLDVEGAEIQVLEGLNLNILSIAFMTIEHGNRPGEKEKLTNFLEKYGYKTHRVNKFDIEFIKI